MVNNSTNINKTNNYLSPQFIEHLKKKTTTYDIGNPSPGLEQTQNVKPINEISTLVNCYFFSTFNGEKPQNILINNIYDVL